MGVESIGKMWYVIVKGGLRMSTAAVFESDRGQAVGIPQEYRFDVDEVFINKVGNVLMLIPKDALAETFDRGVSMLSDDFLCDGIPSSIDVRREEL